MTRPFLTRRRFLIGSTLGASALTLSGCDILEQNAGVASVIRSAENLTMKAQRLLQGRDALAREFAETDISPSFRVNGTSAPDSEDYAELVEGKFANWRLKIDGLVDRPQELSLIDLKRLPARTQITRHDCVEGWSANREMDGSSAWGRPELGRTEAERSICGLSLCRRAGEDT